MKNPLSSRLTLAILVVVSGCASGPKPEPTLQTGPNAEVTLDGLVRVDNAAVPVVYVKPDMDLKPYTRFMLDPVEVAYKKDPGNRRSSGVAGAEGNFALTPSQMENLRNTFQETIVEALTRDNGYELVTEPGPDVLRVTAALLDLVVRVPTDRSGRQDVFTRSYGEVSLILELRDSQSGEILVRAGDRQDPTRDADIRMAEVSPSYVRADTLRLFRYWANLFRERLDAVRRG